MRTSSTVATVSLIALAIAPVIAIGSAAAQDFYEDKRIHLVVATGAGGGYDSYARMFAAVAEKHIPGRPNIVVQNMPGASGLKAVSFAANEAPRDGSFIITFNNAMPLYQALGLANVRFDMRQFHFLGSMSKVNNVLSVWHDTGVKTLEDAKKKSVILGATGATGTMAMYPRLLNHFVGTKFRVVTGYTGSATVNLALARGEVQGRGSTPWTSWKSSHPEWLREKKLNFLVQFGLRPEPELPNVPMLTDLAKNQEQKEIFEFISANIAIERPFAAPPGVPSDRVAILRKAFQAVVNDPVFVQEVKKRGLDLEPSTGDEVQQVVEKILTVKPSVVQAMKAVLTGATDDCRKFSEAKLCRSGKKKGKKKEG